MSDQPRPNYSYIFGGDPPSGFIGLHFHPAEKVLLTWPQRWGALRSVFFESIRFVRSNWSEFRTGIRYQIRVHSELVDCD